MAVEIERGDGRTVGGAIYTALAAFPIACFSAALGTDIAYSQTSDILWVDFSDWLLAIGMAMGGLAALAAIAGLIGRRTWRPGWPGMIGGLFVLLLALLNNLVHSRDAWTSVVPQGLILSALTVLLMIATALLGARTRLRARHIEVLP